MLWTWIRRHPLLTVMIIALVALAISPIWRSRFLPLLDEPNHVSSVYILRHLRNPAHNLAQYYARSIRFVPYVLYHISLLGLSYVMPVEIANKVLQSAYILAFPCAALVWLRRTHRSPALALLAFPLGYSFTWAHGFQPFNVGVPILLFGVSALDALLEKPSIWRVLLVTVLVFLCEIAHPLVFMSFGLAAVALAIAWATRPHRVLLAALCFAPSLAVLKFQVSRSAATPFATGVATASGSKSFDGTWIGWKDMLRYLPSYAMDTVAGDWDILAWWLIAGSAVALVLTGLPTRPQLLRLFSGIHAYRSGLVAAALLGCYLAFPLHLSRPFDWWFVSGRLAGPLCFFAFLTPAGRIVGPRRHLMIPVVLAVFMAFIHIGNKYAEFGRRMQPMVRLEKKIPRNDTALLLSMNPRTDPAVNIEAYRCIGAWLQVLHGGFTPSGFFNSEHPFHVVHSLPSPVWSSHESFEFESQGKFWDWLLVHGTVPATLSSSKSWELSGKEGAFTLYQRRKP